MAAAIKTAGEADLILHKAELKNISWEHAAICLASLANKIAAILDSRAYFDDATGRQRLTGLCVGCWCPGVLSGCEECGPLCDSCRGEDHNLCAECLEAHATHEPIKLLVGE